MSVTGEASREGRRCATCAHFDNRVAAVEAALPGLASFGSAASAVRGDDGVCALHRVYLAAERWCGQHVPATPGRP
jgi:hypothetical protein